MLQGHKLPLRVSASPRLRDSMLSAPQWATGPSMGRLTTSDTHDMGTCTSTLCKKADASASGNGLGSKWRAARAEA